MSAAPDVLPAPESERAPAPPRSGRRAITALVLLALLVVAAFAAWSWWQARAGLMALREEVAQRLRSSDIETRDALARAKSAEESAREVQAKIGAVESKVAESVSQQAALESMYQELARSRDDWVLAEVEQTLTIASQQLQLAGNVGAALTALQAADTRLARSDRPELIQLRKVIAGDIERLRSAPSLDVPGLTLRLDQVLAAIDTLPLEVESRPSRPAPAAVPDADEPWWKRAGAAVWTELKGLIRVQRLDAVTEPALLAPDQRYFLRENVKLRLLHARIALLQRNESAFRSDIGSAERLLSRYFDGKAPAVQRALTTLNQLNAAAIDVQLPTLNDSLTAVRNFKLAGSSAASGPGTGASPR